MVSRFASYRSLFNCSQAFNVKAVKPLDSSTDWTNVDANSVKMVKGRGQTVDWKLSKVTVIEMDSGGTKQYTSLRNSLEGSLKVDSAWELYILGGQFVEKEN